MTPSLISFLQANVQLFYFYHRENNGPVFHKNVQYTPVLMKKRETVVKTGTVLIIINPGETSHEILPPDSDWRI